MSKILERGKEILGRFIGFVVDHDEGIFTTFFMMIVVAVVVGFCVAVGKFIDSNNAKQRELFQMRTLLFSDYQHLHHCERAGFAGRDPEPYYKCDTGIWLTEEIIQQRQTELLQEARK